VTQGFNTTFFAAVCARERCGAPSATPKVSPAAPSMKRRLPRFFIPLPSSLIPFISHLLRGALDRAYDPRIGAAAADVRAHVLHDLLAARVAVFPEERRGAHDLAGLAVAALRH